MSVTLIYGARTVFNCETSFDEQVIANVTQSTDGTNKKKGTYASKIAVASGFTTGVVASKAITSTNFSLATQIKFWIRSSVGVSSGDLKFLLDNTANCASPTETLTVGALSANTWSEQTLTLSTPANCTAIISIGVQVDVDKGAQDIWIDDVRIVSESKTFNELYVKGFDAPDNEDCFPDIETRKLLSGDWYETVPLVATRSIEIGIVTTTPAEFLFLRNWYFAPATRQITYDSETVDVVRDGSNFIMDWADGFQDAKMIVLRVKEKTARALNTLPSSWTN